MCQTDLEVCPWGDVHLGPEPLVALGASPRPYGRPCVGAIHAVGEGGRIWSEGGGEFMVMKERESERGYGKKER